MHTLQAQSLSDRLELLSSEAHAGSSGATLDISLAVSINCDQAWLISYVRVCTSHFRVQFAVGL